MFAQLPLQVFIALAVLVWWLFPVVLVASPALFLSPPLVLNLCVACFFFCLHAMINCIAIQGLREHGVFLNLDLWWTDGGGKLQL